jgi:fibronectin-binding autotransporter adhesin
MNVSFLSVDSIAELKPSRAHWSCFAALIMFFSVGASSNVNSATGFFSDGTGAAIFYVTDGATSGEGTYRNVSNLNGLNYGEFVVGSNNLLLRGGEAQTFKNDGGNVTGVNQYYRIYLSGATPGSFTSINLPFDTNLGDGGNQRWKTTASNVNLLSGLTVSGTYTVQYYWQMFSNQGNPFMSNSGNNYSTTFDLYYDITAAANATNAQNASGGTGVFAGSGKFVKRGDGTTQMTNANSGYTGQTFIDAGTVEISASAGLGNGTVSIGAQGSGSAAALRLSSASGETSIANNIIARSGGGARLIASANTSGVNTLSGNITLSNSLAFNVASGGTLLFGGGLSTLTGGSDVTRLALDGGGTLIVTNAGSGMPTTDRFQMRIGNGTLVIGAGTILARTNTSGLGHALDLGVDLNNAPVDGVSALRASNSVTISNSIYVSTTNSQARILGASGANATATFSGPIGLANAALWLDSTNGQTVSVSGAITNISGTGSLIKTNAGLAVLSGANAYVGTTLITNGNLRIANNSALGTSAAGTTVGSGAALELSNNIAVTGEALTLNGTGISSGGALRNVHGNNSSSGAITLASGSRINSDTGTLTLSGGITGAGIGLTIGGAGNTSISGTGLNTSTPGTLTKDGAGVLTISAAGDYTGGTTLSEGTLRLNHVTAAGSGKITQSSISTLEINTTGTVANTMDLYNVRTMQTVTLSGNKTLFNATYTVDADTTTTESGDLTGGGGITKAGAGTLIVTGNNTYTGAVAVNAGLLNLNSGTGGAAASAASVSVASGATLLISQSNQVNNSATVSLSGGTIQRASGVSETFGTLDLTGNSTLDFGTGGVGNLTFGTYEGGTTPSHMLSVSNFAAGNTLVFGSNVGSFLPTGGALSNAYFSFNNGFTYNSSTFTITAIPEPSTYAAAAGLLAMFLWPVRRRLVKDVKSILGLRPTGRERIEAYRKA